MKAEAAMVDANWLPVPGLLVSVAGLALLLVSLAAYRRPWSVALWDVARTITLSGVSALFLGLGLALRLTGA